VIAEGKVADCAFSSIATGDASLGSINTRRAAAGWVEGARSAAVILAITWVVRSEDNRFK
jgi:hypothetical protein